MTLSLNLFKTFFLPFLQIYELFNDETKIKSPAAAHDEYKHYFQGEYMP